MRFVWTGSLQQTKVIGYSMSNTKLNANLDGSPFTYANVERGEMKEMLGVMGGWNDNISILLKVDMGDGSHFFTIGFFNQ